MMLKAILPWSGSANAQVTSDGTNNTIVNPSGNNFTIINGIEKGNNLFHSFSNFSVPTGAWATFDLINTPNITTIFSRVTGGNISNIDGLISTLNSHNAVSLFLMNPAGIVFGANARLDIGGSFLGTTANSIKFADGTEFSAVNPESTPLLTISVPIGLQMGQNPGAITVQNTGHRLDSSQNNLLRLGTTPTGLSVTSGKTLGLLGGTISLDGGVLQATSGHIELGSASAGIVNLDTSTWKFDYANIHQFKDIQFSNQALANASGNPAGSIHFQGENIRLTGGSGALLFNQGNKQTGDIVVNASQLFEMLGGGTFGFDFNFLHSDNVGTGVGSNLVISAAHIRILDGGNVSSQNFSAGTGGKLSATAADSIEVIGSSLTNRGFASVLSANTLGSGRAGNVEISTRQLRLQEGGAILDFSGGTGDGGNSTINASELIELIGENAFTGITSLIVVNANSQGNAGQLTINTPRLSLRDGAAVSASALASGNSGNLVVNVSDKIEVSGIGSISGVPSRIGAKAEVLPVILQKRFFLPPFPTGTVGNLLINTSRLQITDGGNVGVEHLGIGNAGNLYINADTIFLDRAGSITAATKSGDGGTINLQANTLVMRHGSNVTATAGGTGNGGNILINSPIILGLENSDIVANAVQGQGGNINITTQGIFGLKYGTQLTPKNDITASSQFGVNGTVDINNFGVDPSSGLVELPVNLVDSSQQIATGCSHNTSSRFVATGRGGVPQNPTQQIGSDVYDGLRLRTWSDIRDISAYRKTQALQAQISAPRETLIQATSWHRNPQGKIELVADIATANVQQPLTCAAVTKN
ncbi:MAG: S-layer family protein [Nostoc sp.]|uniref:S-layer family protein n=1 Tax=Nostoc sp. TaxID=1180 RepID=UPI002FFB4CAD